MSKKKTQRLSQLSQPKQQQTPHLFLATPMYGGQCMGMYLESVLRLQVALMQRGWGFSYLSSYNDALIQRARDYACFKFLKSEATHLLFIDADIEFNANDVIKMIEADEDIVCGMYPKKMIMWDKTEAAVKNGAPTAALPVASVEYVFNVPDDGTPFITFGDHLVPIKHGGTGYMLIKRKVFDEMAKTLPTYNNHYYYDEMDQRFINFFSIGINEKHDMLLSEDWRFCEDWTALGGEIFLAAWARARHVGTFTFG